MRDLTVTGVQTCALPISGSAAAAAAGGATATKARPSLSGARVFSFSSATVGPSAADSFRSMEQLRALAHNIVAARSEEHTSELQSQSNLVCRLLLEKKTT